MTNNAVAVSPKDAWGERRYAEFRLSNPTTPDAVERAVRLLLADARNRHAAIEVVLGRKVQPTEALCRRIYDDVFKMGTSVAYATLLKIRADEDLADQARTK